MNTADMKPKWAARYDAARIAFNNAVETMNKEEILNAGHAAMEQTFIAGQECVCDQMITGLGLNMGR
jgi:hypothetical protein